MALLADVLPWFSFPSSSIAFSPAGVAAHPRPRKLAGVKLGLKIF